MFLHHHHRWSWPITLRNETYQRCTVCGARRQFDLTEWSAVQIPRERHSDTLAGRVVGRPAVRPPLDGGHGFKDRAG